MRISIQLLGANSPINLNVHLWNPIRDVKAKYELKADIQGKHSPQTELPTDVLSRQTT